MLLLYELCKETMGMNYEKNLFLLIFLHLNKSPYLLHLFCILLSTTLSFSSEEFLSLLCAQGPISFFHNFPFLWLFNKTGWERDRWEEHCIPNANKMNKNTNISRFHKFT